MSDDTQDFVRAFNAEPAKPQPVTLESLERFAESVLSQRERERRPVAYMTLEAYRRHMAGAPLVFITYE